MRRRTGRRYAASLLHQSYSDGRRRSRQSRIECKHRGNGLKLLNLRNTNGTLIFFKMAHEFFTLTLGHRTGCVKARLLLKIVC